MTRLSVVIVAGKDARYHTTIVDANEITLMGLRSSLSWLFGKLAGQRV